MSHISCRIRKTLSVLFYGRCYKDMKNFDFSYIIKENIDIENAIKAAIRHEADGGLVLLVIEGKDITFTDRHFGKRVFIEIEGNSDRILFENCTFENEKIQIKNKGKRVFFNECSFKILKGCMENIGYAVFRKCHFKFMGMENSFVKSNCNETLPWELIYTIVIDSKFTYEYQEATAFIVDGNASAALINTEFSGDEKNVVVWTKEMVNENTYVYMNLKFEGLSGIYGTSETAYEVMQDLEDIYGISNLLGGSDEWMPVPGEKVTDKKKVFYVTCKKNISLTAGREKKVLELAYYPKNADFSYWCDADSYVQVKGISKDGNKVHLEVSGENNTEESMYGFLTITSDNGIKVQCVAEIKPSFIEPPRFLSTPVVTISNGRAYVNYELDLGEREDQSEISWYRVDNIDRTKLDAMREFTRSNERDCRKIAISRRKPCKEIALTKYDVGKHIKVNIKPKHSRSDQGPGLNVVSRIVMQSDVRTKNIMFNLENQVLNSYYMAEPGYGTTTGIWSYKRLSGCKHSGMVTESSDCAFYFNGNEPEDRMSLYAVLDMENNDGEGFKNRGEYQEIYIKYDSNKRKGYGLRYECVDVSNHISGFTLYKYDGLLAQPISSMVMGSYMKSGMEINLEVAKNLFIAEIFLPDAQEPVIVKANIEGNIYSGIGIKNNVVDIDNNRIGFRHLELSFPEII